MNETTAPITATLIPTAERVAALPAIFGARCTIVETAIFNAATNVIRGYKGAYWDFYRTSNGAFFMAPDLGRRNFTGQPGTGVTLDNPGAMSTEEMSQEAAGIVCCLHAYSHLSFAAREGSDYQRALVEQFHALRDFALDHAEAGAIMSAID